MGYREDIIEELKNSGRWDVLPQDVRDEYEKMTDEQAREVLVLRDEFEVGNPESAERIVHFVLGNVFKLFDGALISRKKKGKLSKAGKLLAQLLIELHDRQVSADSIEAGFRALDDLTIAALIMLFKGSPGPPADDK